LAPYAATAAVPPSYTSSSNDSHRLTSLELELENVLRFLRKKYQQKYPCFERRRKFQYL